MQNIIISDPTLRDGNHAASHKINLKQIEEYCKLAEEAKIDIIEVGHGNGLGGSSLQLGKTDYTDIQIVEAARSRLKQTKLGIHFIPGFGRIQEIDSVLSAGVDIVRVASHCTEADTTKRYIEHIREKGNTAYGVLMMSHMAEKEVLLIESRKMASYGAQGIILMDSAGAFLPSDVKEKISYLVEHLNIPIGFHAHNNLGVAVANSLEAATSGAKILDATIGGYGAGAGNTPLEILVAVLIKSNFIFSACPDKIFSLAKQASTIFPGYNFAIDIDSIISGLFGVFSGFSKPVKTISESVGVSAYDIYKRLGEMKVIAGQEDLIIEVAQELRKLSEDKA